ncbi:hypothetical protein IW261DRAFT_1420943 [Armillaria novae-zelandiae]|uniref:Uncharacterized protein n=1 Tax=Armillaria novae-zelandiae TaxID=153914 RepID=A0AA39P5H3_9AGAR|nr:hypothetical protein IW261DRAFT_1420943 [Armillaria novae-zelandiae]
MLVIELCAKCAFCLLFGLWHITVSHIHAEPMAKHVPCNTDSKKLGGPSAVLRTKPCKAFRKSLAPNAFKLLRAAKKPQFSSSSESDVPPLLDDGNALATQKEPLLFPSDSDSISDVFTPPPSKCVHVKSPAPEEPTFPPPSPSVPTPPLPVEGLSTKAKGKQRAASLVSSHTLPIPGSAAKLNWPCFNCTLAGIPDECVFEGTIGKEWCTKCKANCHGPCSACWDTNQLHNVATLLDPLMLSWDGAIVWGLTQVEGINTQLELLRQVVNKLCANREVVISELTDGLNAIASHEHGTNIIDAYASVSGFLKSFIVWVGTSGVGSDGTGELGDGENVVESVGDTA